MSLMVMGVERCFVQTVWAKFVTQTVVLFFWQRNQVNLKQVSTMTLLAALPLWIHAACVHKGCGGTNIPCGGKNIPSPHFPVPKFSPHCQICLFFATGGPAAGSAWAEDASWKSSCFGLHAV